MLGKRARRQADVPKARFVTAGWVRQVEGVKSVSNSVIEAHKRNPPGLCVVEISQPHPEEAFNLQALMDR